MSYCPMKLACLKAFPEGEAEEFLMNKIVELDIKIEAKELELTNEIADSTETLNARSKHINTVKRAILENILSGQIQSVTCEAFDIKPSQLAHLTMELNRLKSDRAEYTALLAALATPEAVEDDVVVPAPGAVIPEPDPLPEALLTEDEIIAQYNALMERKSQG